MAPEISQARFAATFGLHDFAVEIQRGNFQRRFPEENPEEIERRLVAWLQDHRLEGIPRGLVLAK